MFKKFTFIFKLWYQEAEKKILVKNPFVAQKVESLPAMQDTGSITGSGRFPGEGNGCPLQYSCPENPTD